MTESINLVRLDCKCSEAAQCGDSWFVGAGLVVCHGAAGAASRGCLGIFVPLTYSLPRATTSAGIVFWVYLIPGAPAKTARRSGSGASGVAHWRC